MGKIEADWHKLMEDGADTAQYYLSRAINAIDDQFGKGYAKEHPELISGYMKTASIDNHATVLGKVIQNGIDEINITLGSIAMQLESISHNID